MRDKEKAKGYYKLWYDNNLNEKKLYNKTWCDNNPDKIKIASSVWYKNNINKSNTTSKEWKKNNPAKVKNNLKIWKRDNQGRVKASNAKRRAIKLQATPKWLTKEHWKEIEDFYILAQDLAWLNQDGRPHHVDHIIPLNGINISGLHVPWNLQLLSAKDNMSKGNRLCL